VRQPHLDVGLQLLVKVPRPVAVPEEGHVAKLLRLAAHEGALAVLGQELACRHSNGASREAETGR
jgi:hypothetical protein